MVTKTTVRRSTRPAVLAYLTKRPGVTVYTHEIAEETGLTRDQVLDAIGNLRRQNGFPIESIMRGDSWRYMPETPNKKETPNNVKKDTMLFMLVGKAKDGRLILESEDGTLYSALEL